MSNSPTFEEIASPIFSTVSSYEAYYDESKEGGYWHGILFIPIEQKVKIYSYLKTERERVKYQGRFSYKDIRGFGQKYKLAMAWLSLAIGFLRTNAGSKSYSYVAWSDNERFFKPIALTLDCFGAKFILFHVADDHRNMIYSKDKTEKIETTFRMSLKGGLHFFGDPLNVIHLEQIHFDGHEHYGRQVDEKTVIGKLKQQLRCYCTISDSEHILDTRSSNPMKPEHQDLIDCEFLCLTDLLIGSFRCAITNNSSSGKNSLTGPAQQILDRLEKGQSRMQNSRWNNSFCLRRGFICDNEWVFETLVPCTPKQLAKVNQLDLFS